MSTRTLSTILDQLEVRLSHIQEQSIFFNPLVAIELLYAKQEINLEEA